MKYKEKFNGFIFNYMTAFIFNILPQNLTMKTTFVHLNSDEKTHLIFYQLLLTLLLV